MPPRSPPHCVSRAHTYCASWARGTTCPPPTAPSRPAAGACAACVSHSTTSPELHPSARSRSSYSARRAYSVLCRWAGAHKARASPGGRARATSDVSSTYMHPSVHAAYMRPRDAATASDETPCGRVFHGISRERSALPCTARAMRGSHTRTAAVLLPAVASRPDGRYATDVTASCAGARRRARRARCASGRCIAGDACRTSHTYTAPSRAPLHSTCPPPAGSHARARGLPRCASYVARHCSRSTSHTDTE